jgi:hypothetical protein
MTSFMSNLQKMTKNYSAAAFAGHFCWQTPVFSLLQTDLKRP